MAITIECRGKIKSDSGEEEKLCRKRHKLGTKICSKCGFNLKRGETISTGSIGRKKEKESVKELVTARPQLN